MQSRSAGTAVALPPSKDAVSKMEDSNAKEALLAESKAAGAYDRVPFANASAIFTMDTSNDIFLLHSLQVLFPFCRTHICLFTGGSNAFL